LSLVVETPRSAFRFPMFGFRSDKALVVDVWKLVALM
jgi:hypothetical protein